MSHKLMTTDAVMTRRHLTGLYAVRARPSFETGHNHWRLTFVAASLAFVAAFAVTAFIL